MSNRPVRLFSFILSLFLVVGSTAEALTWSDDFLTSAQRDDSTLVWNTVLGQLHPPLQVYQYLDGTLQDKNFSIGTGRDGAFTPSRYSEFSQNGDVTGNIIRLDTSAHQILEFTTFELSATWTLQPVGDKPLIIRVLGTVSISGDINCSGQNGGDQNTDPTVLIAGGAGRCGGGHGGAGSTMTTAAVTGGDGGVIITDGVSPGVDGPTGGAGATGTGSGGGGGGAYAISRGVGFDPTAGGGGSGGAAGFIAADNDFDYEGGGFGGGGGSHFTGGGPGFDSAGAGGGGGGGHIFITAGGDILISGDVTADGGDGGTGTTSAGGGGGGGGGSIAMFSGGSVTLIGGAIVSADAGLGQGPIGHVGGNGSVGRTWLVGSNGYSTGGPPYEFPDPSLTDVGLVRFQTGIFTALSNEFDSANTKPSITAVSETSTLPGGSTLTIEAASSSQSGFTPIWQSTSALPLELERFLRFQITLNSLSVTTPATLDVLTLDLNPTTTNNFEFIGACGTLLRNGRPPTKVDFLWYILFSLLPLIGYLGLRCQVSQ